MNYDGKAIVIDIDRPYDAFFSDNGSAVVMPVTLFKLYTNLNDSNVVGEDVKSYNNDYKQNGRSHVINGLIPHTVQVYNTNTLFKENHLLNIAKIFVYDARRLIRDIYIFEKVKVSDMLIPTNFLAEEVTAYVTDKRKNEFNKDFASVSVNVTDKTEISVPSISDGYQDISIVVQKNCFIELTFSDTIINVTGLPEGLEYTLNVIKGTITKAGVYNITIQYQDDSQKLSIMVPYYQRLL